MQGRVIWITGLSGAGKTTLAKALLPCLPAPALLLDGDELREALALLAGGYSREDRLKLALTYARLVKLTAEQGCSVVCSTISLFHEVHAWNRAHLPGYIEVYLEASDAVRRERDYKGVYAKQADTANAIMGSNIIPEIPLHPDLTFVQGEEGVSVESMRDRVLKIL
jgi:adenylylsulfate kinase